MPVIAEAIGYAVMVALGLAGAALCLWLAFCLAVIKTRRVAKIIRLLREDRQRRAWPAK